METKTRRLPRYYRQHAANRFALRVIRLAMPMRERGWPLWRMAAALNRDGERTFTGQPWTVGRLSQVLKTGQIAAMDEFAKTQDRSWIKPAVFAKGDSRHADS